MKKTFNYDKEHDMFAIHNGFSQDEDFETNLEFGDLILDISTKKRIVGIEIMDASKYLKKFLKNYDIREILENIEDARLDTKIEKKNINIVLTMITKSKKEIAKITIPIPKSVR